MKGQGATEYLVLLAVVLMIALVSIALLGFFPGLGADAKRSESNTYWKSARPFSIIDYTVAASGGAGSLVMQNNYLDQMSITAISITGCTANGLPITLGAGEKRVISLSACAAGTTGAAYEFSTNITYSTSDLSGFKQSGTKPLVGKYT